jgi:hypothetical protein
MDFQRFEARAHEIFASIPEGYREGIDGLEVELATVEHPSLPEVFTLGECRSEYYPSDYGGAGDVLSMVVLFYGSFLELSRRQDDFDWEAELWETITHEVRHHLESLAADDALEVRDYAEDQNFARREGEPFEPFFFRWGEPAGDGAWEVDGDVFVELPMTADEFAGLSEVRVRWRGGDWRAARPERLGDVHFVRLREQGRGTAGREPIGGAADSRTGPGDGTEAGEEGAVDDDEADGVEVHAVLVRRRGALEWLRGLLGGGRIEVLETGSDDGEAR